MNLQTSSSRSSGEHAKIECKNKSITDRNNYILCKECGRFYFGSCNIHSIPLNNKSTNALASNKSVVSLPDSLEIKKSSIPNAGLGVFAKTNLPIGVNFGPYQGKKVLPQDSVDSYDSRYTWEIIKDGEVAYYIDGTDDRHANWMRYINCSRYEAEQNLAAYQYHNQVYHCTYKEVNCGEELLIWYGNCYADHLGINIEQTKKLLRTKDDKNRKNITEKNGKRSIDTKHSSFHDTKRKIENSLEYLEEKKKTPVSVKNNLPTSNKEINSKLEDNQPISSLDLSIDNEAIIKRYPKRSKRINYKEENNTDNYTYSSKQCKQNSKQSGSQRDSQYNKSSKCYSIKRKKIAESSKQNLNEPYKYKTCNSRFQCKNDLTKHQRVHNNKDKPFKCSICDYKSSLKCNLKGHMKIHTTNVDKPFKCTICDYKSSLKGNLKCHMKIHTNEKPFKCTICDYKSAQKVHVKVHMRIHTKEKPFTCLICDHKFTQKAHVNCHMKIHTNEKPFKCTICDYKSSQKVHVKVHMKIHTNVIY